MEITPKAMDLTPQAWEIEIIRSKRLNHPHSAPQWFRQHFFFKLIYQQISIIFSSCLNFHRQYPLLCRLPDYGTFWMMPYSLLSLIKKDFYNYSKKRLVSPVQISNFVRLSLAPHASYHFQSVYVKPESKMKELLSGQRIVIQRIILTESTEGNF